MKLQRIFAIFLRYMFLLRNSPIRIISLYIWVLIDMVVWGFLTHYLNTVAQPGLNFIPALLGAVLLADFFARVMLGITTTFLEDVWSRNFLNIFSTPMNLAEYAGGLVLSGVATSLIALVLMFLLAGACFGLHFFAYGPLLFPFVAVLLLFGIALGILGISMVLRFGPASEWLLWAIPAVLAPFGGALYPIATLPHWMQAVAQVLPLSYIFESLRAIVNGQPVAEGALLTSFALTLFYMLAGYGVFTRIYKRAVRTGLIARYSAESTS